MADSPLNADGGVLTLSVTCDGSPLPDHAQILSCSVCRALNTVPWARLELLDGEMPTGTFPWSDGAVFKPGAEVKISAGYGGTRTDIFSGIVLRHGLNIEAGKSARLVVECRDKAGAMTLRRHSANFSDKKDSDVLSSLISAAAGLSADVASTDYTHPLLAQHYCSDWDFMVARAEANGMVVLVDDGTVSVQAPDASGSADLTVTWGVDLLDFRADLDARTQAASAQAVAWDPKTQAAVLGAEAKPQDLGSQGNLTGAALAQVVGQQTLVLRTDTAQGKEVLDAWAKAVQAKAALARIRGSVSFQGSALAKVGGLIELKGVGDRFNGTVYVSAVRHEIKDGDWTTRADFGLDPDWHLQRPDVVTPKTGGLLPGVNGLQIGVMLKLDGDPAGENRVQVQVPAAQAETAGVWARLAQFSASSGFGAFFVPEVGDEVVLGYFNDDPGQPVVLGSLYSSSRAPAYALSAENDTKALVTRAKNKFEFDEKNKKITLTTPGGNSVVLDDTAKSVTVTDQNGNSVKLSSDGIVLDSPKDIKITAKGGITLDAVNAVSVSSKADVKLAGMNVACEAQVGFTGKGSATAELSASGQTTVKGAMVMIN